MHKSSTSLECSQAMAEHYQHIIVAPDSRFATTQGWTIANSNQAPSLDMLHTMVSPVSIRSRSPP